MHRLTELSLSSQSYLTSTYDTIITISDIIGSQLALSLSFSSITRCQLMQYLHDLHPAHSDYGASNDIAVKAIG